MFHDFLQKPYFLVGLLHIACDEQNTFGSRQLAVLVLKNVIIDIWTNPELSQSEKDTTLDKLLSNISISNSRIRNEICRIVGLTVSYDFPHVHQNFLPALTTYGILSEDKGRVIGSIYTLIY